MAEASDLRVYSLPCIGKLMDASRKSVTPIFVGGCDRSGTTFLAASLSRFPGVIALPESHFLASAAECMRDGGDLAAMLDVISEHPRYGAWRQAGCKEPQAIAAGAITPRLAIEMLIRHYAQCCGYPEPTAFVDHSPPNIHKARALHSMFPDLRFFHIHRDGRAVAASLMAQDWGPNDIIEMAHLWSREVVAGINAVEMLGPGSAMNVRYERLIENGDEALKALGQFIGAPDHATLEDIAKYHPPAYSKITHERIGNAPDRTRLTAWKKRLRPRQIEIFEALAGDTLEALGYEFSRSLARRPPDLSERLRYALVRKLRYHLNALSYDRRHKVE